MPQRPDESAMYEAIVHARPAGSASEQRNDRDRARLYVARLNGNGWALVPADELKAGEPTWLKRLRDAAAVEHESVDELVEGLLADDGPYTRSEYESRNGQLEELLERNDIEVPEWL